MERLSVAICALLLAASGVASGSQAPTSAEAVRGGVVEHMRRGDVAAAESACRAWLSDHPDDLEITHMLGLIRLTIAQRSAQTPEATRESEAPLLEEARRLLERAVALSDGRPLPGNDHALGYIALREGRLDEAVEHLTRGLATTNQPGQLLLLRGTARMHMGELTGAEADLRRAADLAPRAHQAQVIHAQALFRLGRPEAARERLESYYARIRDEPPTPLHAEVLYDLYRYSGNDLEGGLAYLERARRIAPGDANTRSALGIAYYRLGRVEAALENLRFVSRQPGLAPAVRSDVLHHLGLIAKHQGDHAAARTLFEEALALTPSRAETLQHYGAVLRRLGEEEKGREVLERFAVAVKLQDKARRLIESFMVVAPDPSARVDLVRILIQLGRHEEAAEHLDRLRRMFPDAPEIPELEAAVADAR